MVKVLFSREKKDKINQILRDVSEGDLSVELSLLAPASDTSSTRGILRKTIASIKNIIHFVNKSTVQVHKNVNQLSESAEMIAQDVKIITKTIHELSEGIQQSAGETVKIAEEMYNINHIAKILVEKNNHIVKSSENVEKSVRVGLENVGHSVEIMNNLNEESKKNEETTYQLLQASKEISKIIHIIRDIADRTRLLALNANIEAARAGTHGKGFAIVAEEIGKLASQSKESTEHIEVLVSKVVDKITNSSERTILVQSLVNQAVESIGTSSLSLNQIQFEIKSIKNEIDNIDQEGKYMLNSTKVISNSLDQSSSIIEELSAGSQEVLASSTDQQVNIERTNETIQETAQHMNTLAAVVSQFKLPKTSHTLINEIEYLYELTLKVRGIMVKMVSSTDQGAITSLCKKKETEEKKIVDTLNNINGMKMTQSDKEFLEQFKYAWNEFCEITKINTKLMIDGRFNEAKSNLINKGRQRFRKVNNVFTNWLDV
ncbi:hypothetical protein BKP37_04040 [Anaerobacillus alkalilacustris]|uniref:Methyl-accepting transducer domain-containing protein n=1 Tax=Anaerobacillus alkalilacustris TaxID=393763 RepID=A0A1S2LYS2_9BACI|nr:methyl-accepting chemotaxis protein [Anaerobacillus alkalilacustris]OIJ17628.1 hypothetical protein BKP37_04040 [Anaerobacillus alkalilacustris]